MLKRLAAGLLLVGLVLPYGSGVRPLTGAWDGLEPTLMIGIPLLIAVAYVLHTFLPPLARFHERNGPALHGLFRVVYFVLAGMYLHDGIDGDGDGWVFWVAALLVTGGLLYWSQGRGTKAQRLPLLLLVVVGLPAVYYCLSGLDMGGLQAGGWVFTGGWVLAVAGEVVGLRGAAPVAHGG
ncbi:MAG: hypothetical protein ACREMC_05870 [Gemmatimonadales bacterium]